MRCTSPRTVGFNPDGKTICWSPKKYSKEFATFQIPCGKCLSCRLENARQTAVRCVHEAQMHEGNSFVTLTYSDENLTSSELQYSDFQTFVKKLRTKIHDQTLQTLFPSLSQNTQRELWRDLEPITKKTWLDKSRISVFGVGEYGDKNKRPHWHALLFNFRPSDLKPKYTSDRGDQVYTSAFLTDCWPHGNSELGQVTFHSAGYCARYSSKKLIHGPDGTHSFTPISRRSARNAIGKTWIEKYWKQTFDLGYIIINEQKSPIPRYYERWLKEHQPHAWNDYVTKLKLEFMEKAKKKEEALTKEEKLINLERQRRMGLATLHQITRAKAREKILKQKHEKLLQHLKI